MYLKELNMIEWCFIECVCVYCGLLVGLNLLYLVVVWFLGGELVKRGIFFVYGGGFVGFMGSFVEVVNFDGGLVLGIIFYLFELEEISGKILG